MIPGDLHEGKWCGIERRCFGVSAAKELETKDCSGEAIEKLFGWNSLVVFLMHEGREKAFFARIRPGQERQVRWRW